jgi:hypothetical protein
MTCSILVIIAASSIRCLRDCNKSRGGESVTRQLNIDWFREGVGVGNLRCEEGHKIPPFSFLVNVLRVSIKVVSATCCYYKQQNVTSKRLIVVNVFRIHCKYNVNNMSEVTLVMWLNAVIV